MNEMVCDIKSLKKGNKFIASSDTCNSILYCYVTSSSTDSVRAQVINGNWELGFSKETGYNLVVRVAFGNLPHNIYKIVYTGEFPKSIESGDYNEIIGWYEDQLEENNNENENEMGSSRTY